MTEQLRAVSTPLLPGIYPRIVKRHGHLGGRDNLGVGEDEQGVRYLMKSGALVGVAEFVGAAVCAATGIRRCQPAIVELPKLTGSELVFGSVWLDPVHQFEPTNLAQWRAVCARLGNAVMFSATLAVDLALGNDDRHAANWLVRPRATTAPELELVALDFSRAWPVCHPPHAPHQHPSNNTWGLCRHWVAMGVIFDRDAFYTTCATIGRLDAQWLLTILQPLQNVWLTSAEVQHLCHWWGKKWNAQVIDTIQSLQPDGTWP
jgi:hypothetical protein